MTKLKCTKATSADSSFGTSSPSLSWTSFFVLPYSLIILIYSLYFKNNPAFKFAQEDYLPVCFFNKILKKISISEIEYDPSGKSNLSFQVRVEVLNVLLYAELIFFPCIRNT